MRASSRPPGWCRSWEAGTPPPWSAGASGRDTCQREENAPGTREILLH